MKHRQQAAPEYTTDADGQRLVHVAMANSQRRATLYAEDYQRLTGAGFSSHWCYVSDGQGNAYPALNAYTAQGHNRLVIIARLIACPGAGKRVRCVDGDNLNLRAENLQLEAAPVWRAAADWYPTAAALRAAGITPLVKIRKKKDAPALPVNDVRPVRVQQPAAPAAPAVARQTPAAPLQVFGARTVDMRALGASECAKRWQPIPRITSSPIATDETTPTDIRNKFLWGYLTLSKRARTPVPASGNRAPRVVT